MKIYIAREENIQNDKSQVFKRLVNYLENRGHIILNKEAPDDFEQRLNLIKQCEIFIAIFSLAQFDSGFELSYALTHARKKCIVFYRQSEEKNLPKLLAGCTFSNCYLRGYKSFDQLQNILTLFKL